MLILEKSSLASVTHDSMNFMFSHRSLVPDVTNDRARWIQFVFWFYAGGKTSLRSREINFLSRFSLRLTGCSWHDQVHIEIFLRPESYCTRMLATFLGKIIADYRRILDDILRREKRSKRPKREFLLENSPAEVMGDHEDWRNGVKTNGEQTIEWVWGRGTYIGRVGVVLAAILVLN